MFFAIQRNYLADKWVSPALDLLCDCCVGLINPSTRSCLGYDGKYIVTVVPVY